MGKATGDLSWKQGRAAPVAGTGPGLHSRRPPWTASELKVQRLLGVYLQGNTSAYKSDCSSRGAGLGDLERPWPVHSAEGSKPV